MPAKTKSAKQSLWRGALPGLREKLKQPSLSLALFIGCGAALYLAGAQGFKLSFIPFELSFAQSFWLIPAAAFILPLLPASSWAWLAGLLILFAISLIPAGGAAPLILAGGIFAGGALLKFALSFALLKLIRKLNLIPKISSTEREALLAGAPWAEKEFFAGRPNFKNLFDQEPPLLTPEEEAFLNKETERACELSLERDLIKKKELSPEAESFLKENKFFGLIIPKERGGLGFSPLAHAKVIEKLASSNVPLSIIIMVPNSVGPAELILKYGTEEQKNKHLSRLAKGEALPCFGLTEPQAGSDASSIKSEGILFKEDGQLKIRLNWSKRWITMSPKAGLIGLAVKLKDPDKLYSDKESLGITCLLIPEEAPGIKRGLYHDPMGCPIYNAPIEGENVIVPAEEAIIGGIKQAGKGWKMLMESLSAGRGISLPSLSTGCGKKTAWLAGAHSLIRKQFGVSIGKFEGVKEALAPIAGLTHLMSAVHAYSLSGLQQGAHSSVIAALTKYNLTEIAREISQKGMDIMGGAGLSLGPRNKIAHQYMFLPIAITVEGANILTRTLIVYGQGLIKTHPFAYKMISSLEQNNLKGFHKGLWGFARQMAGGFARGAVLSLTRGWLLAPRPFSGKDFRPRQKIAWAAALFAFLSDLSLTAFGGALKTKGSLAGRFADLLSFQYMAIALLWQEKRAGSPKQLWARKWGLEYCFAQIQKSLEAILRNYPHRIIRPLLKPFLILLRLNPIGQGPSDLLGEKLAEQLMEDEEFRKKLCANMHFPKDPEDQFQKLNKAYKLSLRENDILKKTKRKTGLALSARSSAARGRGKISIKEALEEKIISPEEYNILQTAEKARWEAIQADAFTAEEYFGRRK